MTSEFAGTDRYEVRRRLGAGGMGVVFQVFDRERNDEIALKTLRRFDANNIWHLKEEFRALADVMHPNLVVLHELEVAGGQWFFTMELVRGMSLLEFLRAERFGFSPATPDLPTSDDPWRTPPQQRLGLDGTMGLNADRNRERLRFYLRQVATGIHALHQAGKLHRDIKPSNVMLDRAHRAVVLDFGLVTDFGQHRALRAPESSVVGTPEYMAPEQARRVTPTSAADWYSFGIMLYEALTGRLPFHGSLAEIVAQKGRGPPPAPRTVDSSVPPDLDALCVALLEPRPEARPKGDEIIRRIGGQLEAAVQRGPQSLPSAPASALLGREREATQLRAAFERAKQGGAVTVRVFGDSGLGKSELVRHVLRQLHDEGEVAVIDGRCYQRESVPFKTIDSLIDRLTEHWCNMPREEATTLMPPDMALLARIFPVLKRVPAVARCPAGPPVADAREQRQRAIFALSEVLGRLAMIQPLVIFIDDIQWGDVDSVAFLADLMRLPAPACLLLVLAHRREDARLSPAVRALFEERGPGEVPVEVVEVGPLEPQSAARLALDLLGGQEAQRGLAERIAAEAQGSPWFVHELVRDVQLAAPAGLDGVSPDWTPSLGDLLARRMVGLPAEACRLLEVVAVAAGPVAEEVAVQAARAQTLARSALAALRSSQLISVRGSDQPRLLETYHDRVREAVVLGLDPSGLRERHQALGLALEGQPEVDPMTLLTHWKGAGDEGRITRYTSLAAERAEQALAFDQAAQLYREALARKLEPPEQARLWERLAVSLANAGRGAEAAEAFARAQATLRSFSPEDAHGLRLGMSAAEQHLRSGNLAEGERGLRAVTAAVGLAVPRTPAQTLLALGLERTKLALSGLRFKKRGAEEVSPEVRLRLDLCHGAYVGFSLVDPLLAAYFEVHRLRLALKAGEPTALAQSLSSEAVYHASIGGKAGRRRFADIMAMAEGLAAEVEDPYTRAQVLFQGGSGAYLAADWKRALNAHERALVILRQECTGVAWEIASGEMLTNAALGHLGELAELTRRLPRMLRRADERADGYARTVLRLGAATLVHLAGDRVEEARAEAEAAMASWPVQGFLIQHFNHLLSCCFTELYAGEGASALARILAAWPRAQKAHFLRIQMLRVELLALRARAALAAAIDPRRGERLPSWPRERLLAEARSLGKKLAAEDQPWAAALARSVLAGVLELEGARPAALAELAGSLGTFREAHLGLYRAAGDMIIGRLTGGEAGAAQEEQGRAWLHGQGVVEPERLCAMMHPGWRPFDA